MTAVTLELPDELVHRLEPVVDQLPQILTLGLRALQANAQPGFPGAADVFEFLAGLPTPEEILALQPAEALQTRVNALVEKNQIEGLTAAEEQEWQQYEYLEHLIRVAKLKARLKSKTQ